MCAVGNTPFPNTIRKSAPRARTHPPPSDLSAAVVLCPVVEHVQPGVRLQWCGGNAVVPGERREGSNLSRCVVPTVLRAMLIRRLVRVASVFAMPPWMPPSPPSLSLIAAKALLVVIPRLRMF